MQLGTHRHTYNISLVIHSLDSFINIPESLPDRLILTYGKFIFGTSAELYVLTMVSPQVNKNPGPTLDTKPYLLSHKLQRHAGSDHILIFHVTLSLPSCTPILSPLLSSLSVFHLPAFFLLYVESFGISMNKIFLSGK